ncbi:MAG: hypothetical protein QOF64_2212, partial [Candidatus Binatota bacterium]|nr:hypothetical protein [Candidatus Binatota bacterium]
MNPPNAIVHPAAGLPAWIARAVQIRIGLAVQVITLVVVAVVVAGGVIGAVLLRDGQNMLREQIIANNLATADLAAEFASRYIEGVQTSIQLFARSPFIEQSVASDDFDRTTPELQEFLTLSPQVNGCSIVDGQGIMRATGTMPPTSLGASVVDREWFQPALATGEPYLGMPTLTRATSRPVVPYVIPVRNPKRELKGFLLCGISLETLNNAFAKFHTGPSAQATLADRRRGGLILAHSDRSRILKPATGRNQAVERMLAGERGAMETTDSTGALNLAVFAPVPRLPWSILIQQPTESAFAPIDRTVRKNAIYIGLSLLLIATFSGFLARRFTRPLARLSTAANRVGAGELTTRLNFTRHDEFGDLGRTFDNMAATLAERSRQLKTANRELQAQYLQLHDANRLKSEFLANMSHELRTPMNAIIGFTQLIHDGKVGAISADQQEYLSDVLRSAGHLLQLINDVLDLAKIEAGKLEFNPEPIRLTKLITEVRNILQPLAASKHLTIAIEVAESVEKVVLDPAKLKQVLYNYLSNAIKFTPEEGRIILRARDEDAEHFRLEVEDSGIGIVAEEIGKLFVAFQQLDSSAAKRHQGTGLGLALTKKIVDAQGGHVGVESVPGKASLFFAVLPKTAAAKERAAPATEQPSQPVTAQLTVLVIEDSEADIQWLNQTLSAAGFGFDNARTGAEAIEKARGRVYAAVLLDLILPDTGGWNILRSIRSAGLNQNTPVIVVTVVAERGVAKGFPVQDYLVKPLHTDTLLQSLKNAQVVPDDAKPKILVVDHDSTTLKVAKRELQAGGYEVVCHNSALSALAGADRAEYSAVVLDLLMPHMDGFEFLDRFRGIPQCHGVPVIVWTNKDISAADLERLKQSTQA